MAFRPSGYSVKFWAKNLKVLNPDLHARTADKMTELEDGRVLIELNTLDQSTRDELLGALPLLSKMLPPDSMAEHEAMNKVIIDEGIRKGKVNQDREAGMARLLDWAKTGLLEDTRPNSDAITTWLQENVKGYISVANIDAAISILGPRGTNVLTWRKPEAVAPAEPAATLSDGTQQLPLGTIPNGRHSVAQLRDLDQRTRAAKGRTGGVTFGARF
jgi:hypothetical protein